MMRKFCRRQMYQKCPKYKYNDNEDHVVLSRCLRKGDDNFWTTTSVHPWFRKGMRQQWQNGNKSKYKFYCKQSPLGTAPQSPKFRVLQVVLDVVKLCEFMFWLFWPTVRGRLVWRRGWVKKEKGVITQMLDLCGWVVVRRLCQNKEVLKKCKEIQNIKSRNPHKCWIFVGEVLLQGRARARNATVSQIPRQLNATTAPLGYWNALSKYKYKYKLICSRHHLTKSYNDKIQIMT